MLVRSKNQNIHDNANENAEASAATPTMPNVFVVPPEEDKIPAWCYFDAAQPPEHQTPSSASLHVIHSMDSEIAIYDTGSEVPLFHRHGAGPSGCIHNVVMSRKSGELRSVVDALMDNVYEDYDEDEEPDEELEDVPDPCSHTRRDVREDSDVIEIVKVRRQKYSRHVQDPESDDDDYGAPIPQAKPKKHSFTLKSRASKALRSLRGSLRTSRPRAADLFVASSSRSSSESRPSQNQTDGAIFPQERPYTPTLSRPHSPSLSRRGSILAQLFTSPNSIRSRSSFSSDVQPQSRNSLSAHSPSEPTLSAPRSSSSVSIPLHTSPTSSAPSRRLSFYRSLRTQTQSPDPDQHDHPRLRAPSPSPSATNHNRRFSKLNLQRLFSFSSSPMPSSQAPVSDSGRTTPTLASGSSSSTPSTDSASAPQTPNSTRESEDRDSATPRQKRHHTSGENNLLSGFGVEQSDLDPSLGRNMALGINAGLDLGPGSDSYGISNPDLFKGTETDNSDTSFEMRLDSLHFDSLSFDADRFELQV